MNSSFLKPLNLLCLYLFFGCSSTDEPITTVAMEPEQEEESSEEKPEVPVQEIYFTFNIDDSVPTDESQDDWLILHDSDGKLLDFRSFERGDELIFEKRNDSLTENISVTHLKVQFSSSEPCIGDVFHYLTTYPAIPKGSSWTYSISGTPDNMSPDITGNFEFSVTDIPGTDGFRLLKNNFLSFSRFELGGSSSSTPNSNGTLTLERSEVDRYEDSPYLISILDEELNLKYAFFEPELNQDINLSYSNFKSYDDYAYLPELAPNLGYKFRLRGQTKGMHKSNDRGYLIQDIKNLDIQSSLPIGYLDIFDYYETDFDISFENYRYVYQRIGPKPEISIPGEPIINISNSEISNFEINTNFDYTRKVSNWYKSPNNAGCSLVSWVVISNANNHPNNLFIPENITDNYELLELDNLELIRSTFYLQSESYKDFIHSTFNTVPDPNAILETTEELIYITH